MTVITLSTMHITQYDMDWLSRTAKDGWHKAEQTAGLYANPYGFVMHVRAWLQDDELHEHPMVKACLEYALSKGAGYIIFDGDAKINPDLSTSVC